MKLTAIVIDAADIQELADFYATLLSGTVDHVTHEYARVTVPGAPVAYFIQQVDDYKPPVWPESTHEQQAMMHLDFTVEDINAGIQHALSCGATLAPEQFLKNSHVFLDPAGHPFCLAGHG